MVKCDDAPKEEISTHSIYPNQLDEEIEKLFGKDAERNVKKKNSKEKKEKDDKKSKKKKKEESDS